MNLRSSEEDVSLSENSVHTRTLLFKDVPGHVAPHTTIIPSREDTRVSDRRHSTIYSAQNGCIPFILAYV